ncbi:2-dehydropantoate 2-reductase [Balneolales bacterium ANBcel1]|nr:2-dehydropantoate 2-reductase [Balneolales bacterium ANBcel1]
MKHILIMGSGAVGGFYGAHLARMEKHEVTFVARGDHLHALQQNGIEITGLTAFRVDGIAAVRDPSDAGAPPDLVVICVKTFDTREAIEQLRPVIGRHTQVLTLQNGLENFELLVDVFGRDRVIRGFCRIGVEVTEPGVIDYRGLSHVCFGEENGASSNRVLQLQKNFEHAGISCEVSKDIRKQAWLKFIWNGIFNMLTGLANVTIDRVFMDEHAYATTWKLFYEMQAVAGASGVTVTDEDGSEIIDGAEELGAFRTSTFQDRQRGKPLEYEAFCGYLVRKADAFKLPVPANRTLLALYRMLPESTGTRG